MNVPSLSNLAEFNTQQKLEFLDSLQFSDEHYKDLIVLVENLESINFWYNILFDVRLNYTSKLSKTLLSAYDRNKDEYTKFVINFNIKNNHKFSNNEPDLFVLRSFLPSFYHMNSNSKEEQTNKVFTQFGSHFIKPYIWKEKGNKEIYFGKYVPFLIQTNTVFAKHIYEVSSSWAFKDNDKEIVKEALYNADVLPKEIKLFEQIRKLNNKIGVHKIIDGEIVINSEYKVLNHENATKKAFVLYGYDVVGAFKSLKVEQDLYLKDYNVLTIDNRHESVDSKDLGEVIKAAGFDNLTEIYLAMPGIQSFWSEDVKLGLNKNELISSSELFKILVQAVSNNPIKAVIYAADSQLMIHKIQDVIPQGSEILALSENQKIDGINYRYSSTSSSNMKFNEFVGQEDFRKAAILSEYYFDKNCDKTASHTYGKVGECNFRTPVNFKKQDLDELLEHISRKQIIDDVSNYLDNGKAKQEIIADINQFFQLVENLKVQYPLIEYREKNSINSDFHKYLGIAGAIYAKYDQCGEGYIANSISTSHEQSVQIANIIVGYIEDWFGIDIN